MIADYKMSICSQHTLNLNLTLYYCGSKICKEEIWEPRYDDNYTLFYIFSGSGKACIGNSEYDLESNEGFLVQPKETVTFHSTSEMSEIAWVGFYGLGADAYLDRAGLTPKNPVFRDDDEEGIRKNFVDILADSRLQHNRYCKVQASMYMIFSRLLDIDDVHALSFRTENLIENYIKKAMQYINTHYGDKITVSDVANFVGIDRKYLHHIFKEKIDIGPQQYIIIFRMTRACSFLSDTNKSVSDIAKTVGYENPHNFSKMFKKTFGMSPKEYRENPTFIKYNMVTWGKALNNIT
ncbi:AraC family transcriptional regulator [Vallitalea okinawensis]|uniref:AraC family transcriptional regulator n=1 Tax=Vallitalea okinawensis TaxID=2078660 RepID=UPI000CFDF13C|nr:AraC family transcriptional regulator [Vallitalea okinawensis]